MIVSRSEVWTGRLLLILLMAITIVPFVSLYFHEELGVPMSAVGLFFLVTAVVRSSFEGYAGDLSDRLGRVRLMVLGQTARGARRFLTHLDSWPRELEGGGILIEDVSEDLYLVRDPGALDTKSRERLWYYVG